MASKAGAIRAGRAFVELFADDTKLQKGLRRASFRLKAFGSSVSGLGRQMVTMSAAAIGPVVGLLKVFSSLGDQMDKMARRTGVSVEALSGLGFAAKQSGTNLEDLEKVLRRTQRSIYDAGRGLSTAVDGLNDLGLSAKDFDGLSPEDQFLLIGDRLNQVEDHSRKAAIAMTLLGRSGTAILPMFEQGAKGVRDYIAEAERLGIIMSTEQATAAADFTDAMSRLWLQVKMAAFQVGSALGPSIEKIANQIKQTLRGVIEWINANQDLILSYAKLIGKTALWTATIGAGLIVVGKFVIVLGMLAKALKTVAAATVFSTKAIKTSFVAMKGASLAAASALGGPVVIALAAAAAAVGILIAKVVKANREMKRIQVQSRKFGRLRQDEARIQRQLRQESDPGRRLAMLQELVDVRERMRDQLDDDADREKGASRDAARMQAEHLAKRIRADRDQIDSLKRLQKAKENAGLGPDLHTGGNGAIENANAEEGLARRVHQLKIGMIDEENERNRKLIDERYAHELKLAQRQGLTNNALDLIRKARTLEIQALETDIAAKAAEAAKRERQELIDKAKKAAEEAGKKDVTTRGTFNAAAILGLQAGGVQDRIAAATEATKIGVDKLVKRSQNGLVFGPV